MLRFSPHRGGSVKREDFRPQANSSPWPGVNPEQSISCGGSGCVSLGAFDEPTAFEARSGPHVAAAFYPTAMRASGTSRLRVARVHFSPGARTAWHQHPFGQILHVLQGRGRVQQRGHPVEEFQAGDTIVTLPGEWHCHGAAPGTFTHDR